MALLIGAILAIGTGVFGSTVGMDRDRAFYPVIMIVIGCLYALFAVIGAASTGTLVVEMLVGVVFIAFAVLGFKSSLWIVMAALAAHGLFDLCRGPFISNPGVPIWWPKFCGTFDVVIAGYMAWLLWKGKIRA